MRCFPSSFLCNLVVAFNGVYLQPATKMHLYIMNKAPVLNAKALLASLKGGLRAIFLLLACLTLTAQTVLPHYHHDNKVFYLAFDASLPDDANCDDHSCCGDHQQGKSRTGDCCGDAFIVPAREFAHSVPFQSAKYLDTHFICRWDDHLPDNGSLTLPKIPPPYAFFCALLESAASKGLRAPPPSYV